VFFILTYQRNQRQYIKQWLNSKYEMAHKFMKKCERGAGVIFLGINLRNGGASGVGSWDF